MISGYLLRCEKINNEEKKPVEMMVTLNDCDPKFYPNINFLWNILVTLLVSWTDFVQLFSTLKRIKSLLRNKARNELLVELAPLSVHYEVSTSIYPDILF